MAGGSTGFTNFKDAYCSYYGCNPDGFVDHVFWRSLYRHAMVPAGLIRAVYPVFFRRDMEFIKAFGTARSTQEFMMATGEFASRNKGDRNVLRRALRIRISGERLTHFHNQLSGSLPQEQQKQEEAVFRPVPVRPERVRSGVVSQAVSGESGRGENQALILRRLRTAHEEITRGRSLDTVIASSGVSEEIMLEQLDANSQGNPHYQWLRDYMVRERRLRHLETENERLTRKIAQQSMEMDSLRERRDAASQG